MANKRQKRTIPKNGTRRIGTGYPRPLAKKAGVTMHPRRIY